MNYSLSNIIIEKLNENNIFLRKANIDDLNEILNLFKERIDWFKQNNINQWLKYFELHSKLEFSDIIQNSNYFVMVQNNKIIAGFEVSCDSKYWRDYSNDSYYLYKVVTKVGNKNIGNLVFEICKYFCKINNKKYLRLNCISSNKKLNEIYEKYHFHFVKQIKDNEYLYSLREYIVE